MPQGKPWTPNPKTETRTQLRDADVEARSPKPKLETRKPQIETSPDPPQALLSLQTADGVGGGYQ